MLQEQNLNRYRIFYIVAELGSITKAGEHLYISQPAISKSISKLEEDLNTKLFIRTHKGVLLTQSGKILFENLKNAFDAIQTANEQIKKINELGIGHIRIGASTTLCKYLLLPYLKKFIEEYPHIKISIECQSSAKTIKLLEEQRIDIALTVRPDRLKNMDFFSLGEIEDIFVSNEAYIKNLALRTNYKNQKELLENANLMLLDKENLTRQHIEKYLKENNIEVNQILEVSNMDLLIEFSKIGLGIGCVIKEFLKEELENGKIKKIEMEKPIQKREVGFIYLKNGILSDALKIFSEFYKRA